MTPAEPTAFAQPGPMMPYDATQPPTPKPVKDETDPAEINAVKRWLARFDKAKQKWEPDFERMRENMEFVTGLQWEEQQKMRDTDQRYTTNMTLRMVSHKVAQLYARNPTVEAIRRPRLDFTLWDGTVEQLQDCFMRMSQSMQTGMPDLEAFQILQDFKNGRKEQEMTDKICRTLEIVDNYDIDTVHPDFKEQMKQMVRRVIICGVGYVRPFFVREGASGVVSTVDTRHSMVDRAKVVKAITERILDGELEDDSPEVETLKSLVASMGLSMQTQDYEVSERVEHDFLPATSVIPDERCRHLKGFIAARWLFIQYNLPAEEINEMFSLEGDDRITSSTTVSAEDNDKEVKFPPQSNEDDKAFKGKSLLIEVLDYQTKTRFYIVKGYKKYVVPPEPLHPCYPGFWPLVSLTFNDVEIDDTVERASIFPPSDVDLIRDPQKEWNRTRDALRAQRNANAPKYLVRKGQISANDIENIRNAVPNSVIELENCPSDTKPSDLVSVLQTAGIDPAVYNTQPLEQDFMLAGGMQQANMGPAQPDVTATVGTIAEQSRMTVSSSNVDDLDGMLSKLAGMRGQLRLQSQSSQVVVQVVGRGAAWPTLNMKDYLNQIMLTIVAASSGRPNQALEVANFERIAPLLLNAGANPIAVIEEGVRRLGDEKLDVQNFYPVPGMMMGNNASEPSQKPGQPQQGNGQPRQLGPPTGPPSGNGNGAPKPQQPLQPSMSGAAVPLPAA